MFLHFTYYLYFSPAQPLFYLLLNCSKFYNFEAGTLKKIFYDKYV